MPQIASRRMKLDSQTQATPSFYALDNPCYDKDKLCSSSCEVVTMKNDVVCEYCYCKNPENKRKRDNPLGNVVISGHKLKRENGKESYNRKTKRCVPFFCPLFRCPPGKVFEIGPEGCQICRCITKQQAGCVAILGSKPDPTELFCLPSPEYCHSDCLVHNITVDDWHCFFCRCPQGEVFMAMLNPCNHKVRVCPSYCTIRHLEDIILETIRCDYCDCKTTKKQDLERESRFVLQDDSKVTNIAIASTLHCLELPSDCPSYCHAFTVHNNAWKCHVCLCHGVLIPRTFIHHLHSSSLTSGIASTSILTLPYYTKPHSSKTAESHTTSDVPVTTVNRSSPLPTSEVPVTTVNRSSPLPTSEVPVTTVNRPTTLPSSEVPVTTVNLSSQLPYSEVPVTTVNRPSSLPSTEVPVTTVNRSSPLPSSEVPVTTVNRSSQQPSSEVPVTTDKRPLPLPTSSSTLYPNITYINNPTTNGGTISCFICNSINCNDSELQLCGSDKKYCMNTFTAYNNGTKDVSRSCVSEDECNKKWWLKTADDPMCLTLQNGESVELADTKECDFCCTENGCNKNLKIDDHIFIGKE
ncbi:uncharacterized protein LOC127722379 [Mytilus californianus]|uniref:uncharacterized protein LOC127722379 n=1 Tax=Mytilus californianus TaxID=6549 RepID=UPI002245F6A6|nr:uncharacterized protein LOC127722379 [Mytilus californianus]